MTFAFSLQRCRAKVNADVSWSLLKSCFSPLIVVFHSSCWRRLSSGCPADGQLALSSDVVIEVWLSVGSVNECLSRAHTPQTGLGYIHRKKKSLSLSPRVCFSAPLTERGSMCFSGCQDCLAVQCKQIAASIPVSQHLPSPVIQLEVLACTIYSCAAIQLQCDAEAAEEIVENSVRWILYCSFLKSKQPVFPPTCTTIYPSR